MRRSALLAASAVLAAASPVLLGTAPASAADPSLVGAFSAPFAEPGSACAPDQDGVLQCGPAAATMLSLATGTVLYWDGLEGTERATLGVGNFAELAGSDKSRVLDLRGDRPRWSTPVPADGGANPDGNDNEYLPGILHGNDNVDNDGNLFCADQVHLADGRILATGGTAYYNEPGLPGQTVGAIELEGLKNSRIFDPATSRWSQTPGSMAYGRWYPSLVTLADGKVFAASGVTKLIKPLYPDRPEDSGSNVRQTETFDPATGTWSVNEGGDRSLPLYPRLHLLPNGHVFYDAAGQTFNPMGYSYDEALWNLSASYDPATRTWTDLGVPGVGTTTPGFRGSGFSLLLPLVPGADGRYTKVQTLSAGGVAGVTPGGYLAVDSSQINEVDTSAGDKVTTTATGPLTQPRWYGTGVVLPTGEVAAFSGADRDEVVAPGAGFPRRGAEIYDPVTKTWSAAASATQGRTYHNAAMLLPDGRVLVGGHAPIPPGYGPVNPAGNENLGTSNPRHDQTFEVFSPPYLFRGPRPVIRQVDSSLAYGRKVTVKVTDAASVESVVLVRNTAITHLIDGDQRTVTLPIVKRSKDSVTVLAPPDAAVAPRGPYQLFVNARRPKGLVPSVSRQVFVGVPVPGALASAVAANNAAATQEELKAVAAPKAAPKGRKPAAPARPVSSAAVSRPGTRPSSTRPATVARRFTPARTGAPAVIALVAAVLVGGAVVTRRLRRTGPPEA
jgi:hypothetical protein